MAADDELEDTQMTEGAQENAQASEDEEPIVTRMIGICAPQVRGRGPRNEDELLNSERTIRRLRHEALASRPPLLRNQCYSTSQLSTHPQRRTPRGWSKAKSNIWVQRLPRTQ